jgi:hypothetical protein
MLILQALILWSIMAALIVGGAMLFHRRWPDESPWLGFLVPALVVVLLLNFIEHLVALPSLLLLLPFLLGGTLWLATRGRGLRGPLVFPTFVFLGAFAATFAVRCLQPNIMYTSDGISDLNMVNNFLQGEKLPPTDTWMPPTTFEWYYDLQHYAASIVARLLGVKIGVADNVSHALLNALVCFTAAACAHRLSGGRVVVTCATGFLILAAATGSSAYLILFAHSRDQWLPADLSTGMALTPPDTSLVWQDPLWSWLRWDPRPAVAGMKPPETLRLQVPGFWTWRDEYHANAAGHLITLLGVLIVAELTQVRRSVWPWVLAALLPLLAATASAWALPIAVFLGWVTLPVAWLCGRRPVAPAQAGWILLALVVLTWPALYNVTSNPQVPAITATDPAARVPILEFLVQWWPILALLGAAAACWRDLSFGLRWMLLIVPLMLIAVELVTIESRYNTIEKMWGYTWAVGLAAFFPVIASRAGVGFRILAIVLVACGLVSFGNQLDNVIRWSGPLFQLDGAGYLREDPQKRELLQAMAQTKKTTYLAGKCAFCYNEAPALTVFTGNRAYIAWSWFESHANLIEQAQARDKFNNAFYDGSMNDRLGFLRANRIDGVVVWPDDSISDTALDALHHDLDADYAYVDCRGKGPNNAGIFMRRPAR